MGGEGASSPRDITVLNDDVLVHCASYLKMEDIANLSLTCKYLNRVSSSDSIWLRWFGQHWPHVKAPTSAVKASYISRLAELRKFNFRDPKTVEFQLRGRHIDHLYMDKDSIVLSQGNMLTTIKIDSFGKFDEFCNNLRGHNARITCVRLLTLSCSEDNNKFGEKIIATSSADHCIRLWSKGSSQRCFRGHSGPVLTLSDKLLGDETTKLLASGGEDATVRLWALDSCRKNGQHALRATLHGHQKPIKLLSVPEHKSSLLISISTNSKVRIWDAITASVARYSSCVGMTTVSGAPIDMTCHDSMLYVAAGTSVVAIDIRTMQIANTCAVSPTTISSFKMVPSKLSFCTGAINGKALLWDVRRNQNCHKAEPVAELDGHSGPVTFLHMDTFKVITGSCEDPNIYVWDGDTGTKSNSLVCCDAQSKRRYSAIAAYGTQLVVACYDEDHAFLHHKNFFNSVSCAARQDNSVSRFWHSTSSSYSDSDSDTFVQ